MPPATPTTAAGSSLNPHSTFKPEQRKPFTMQTTTATILEPPPPSNTGPIRIDGSENDDVLSKSEFLTRAEVLKRRSRRTKQLIQIYRNHYWALMEEVKLKYREYVWEYGKSPFVEDEENGGAITNCAGVIAENNGNSLGVNGGNVGNCNGNVSSRCSISGCKAKAMALAKYCHMHILFDTRQQLYKSCEFVIKSSASGAIVCGKPILKTTVPSYCSLHFGKAEKYTVRALKKAGLNVTSTSKLAPKFHVLVSEYVRQIQQKRRAAQRAKLGNGQLKVVNRS